MTLIKTSVLTAISTAVRLITLFIINKIVSIYVGPSGLAVIGQLQNYIAIVMTFSNGAITQGIIKYTAECRDDIERKRKLFSTALIITLSCSVITGLFLNIFASFLSKYILTSNEYSNVFIIFGYTILLFSLNTLLMSILNGQKEINSYVVINIISSLFSLTLTSLLIIEYGLIGALYALVLNQSVILFVTLAFILKASWFSIGYFYKGFDKDSAIKLGKYSLMALSSSLMIPASHLIVRNYIGEKIGWDAAGYWQGIWYISTIYLMVITTSLSIYYLPRLSEIQNIKVLKKEVIDGYKIVIPIITALAFSIYMLRELVVRVAFTEQFLPMLELFKWQLIGDILKIASWLLSYVMIAKAMTRLFIYTEVIFNLSFVILSILCVDRYGLVGVTYAFSLNYLFYFLTMIVIAKKKYR